MPHSESNRWDPLDLLRNPRGGTAVHFPDGSSRSWPELAQAARTRATEMRRVEGVVARVANASWETLAWVAAALAVRRPLLLLHPRFPEPLQEEIRRATGAQWQAQDEGVVACARPPVYLNPGTQLLLPTSGSTAAPKVVQLSRENLLAAVQASSARLPLRARDRWLLALPLAHVGGVSVFLRCMAAGASVELAGMAWREPKAIEALVQAEVTHASLVPTQLVDLLENPAASRWAHTLRVLLVGGAPAPPHLRLAAQEAGLPALYTYGMTETCAQVCTQTPRQRDLSAEDSEDVGRPLPGVEVEVRDDESIWVRGPQVMLGYVGQPPRGDAWLATGDHGSWDPKGRLVVRGRIDTLLITGGENVSPEWLESRLLPLAGVDDLAVTGVVDARWGQRLVACVVLRPSHPAARRDPGGAVVLDDEFAEPLRAACAQRVPRFAVPKDWVVVSELPRLAGGKLDRQGLVALARGLAKGSAPSSRARQP